MGFMAGFGPSFSRSFENSRDRAAQERQDVFRLTYQDYMQRQQQYDEWNREDNKAVKAAQDYEQMYDLPEGSWTQIYSWVKSGHDADQIQKWIQTGQFQADDSMKPQQAEAAQGIDSEMQQTGMATPSQMPQPQQAAPEQRDTGLFGNLLGNLAQKGKTRTGQTMDQKRRGMAIQKIADNTGRSLEEVQAVMDGYKPMDIPQTNVRFTAGVSQTPDAFSNPNDAWIEMAQARSAFESAQTPATQERYRKAKERVRALQDKALFDAETDALAKGVSQKGDLQTIWDSQTGEYKGTGRIMRGPDGEETLMVPGPNGNEIRPLEETETVLPVTDEERKFRADLNSDLAKKRETLDVQRENTQAMFHNLNVMNQTVVNTQGEVLKGGVASVTSNIEKWAVNIAAGAQKLSQAMADPNNEGKEVVSRDQFDRLLAAEKALLAADKNDLGAQKLLFDTQTSILAYRIGMAMGQEGRGLAETERKMFAGMAAGGWTVDQFYDNMANLTMPIVKAVDQASGRAYGEAAEKFKGDYGYVPGEFQYEPLQEELSTNDEFAPLMEEFIKRDRSGAATIIQTDKQTGDPAQTQPQGLPVGTKKEWAGKVYVFRGGNPNDKNSWEEQ